MSLPRKPARLPIWLYGGVQLILALMSANWAWTLWNRAEGGIPAAFWGALALTLFLLGGAQINLVGPLREPRGDPPPPKVLPYRLPSQFGEAITIWTMFSLAFTFGAPVLPLIVMGWNAEGALAEWSLIWGGLALTGAILGGATFVLGLQKLYERLNGSQTLVEASAETVKPGEEMDVFVQFTPGKLPVARLQVKLVCQETHTPRNRSNKVSETKVLYEAEVASFFRPERVWQGRFSVIVPETAPLSLASNANHTITWGLEVIAEMPGAPDVKELFLFTVDDPAQRARLEAKWSAEDALTEM